MKINIRNLLTVKSIVTLSLTVTFIILCIYSVFNGKTIPEYFTTVYSVIIAFYFGTQTVKDNVNGTNPEQ
jgi:hypothetical protein